MVYECIYRFTTCIVYIDISGPTDVKVKLPILSTVVTRSMIRLHRVEICELRAVTQEITRVKCAIFASIRSQFDDRPLFGTLAFRNGLEYRNFDSTRLIGDHFSSSCQNLVRLGPVTTEPTSKILSLPRFSYVH